jgi:hypothetical protein
MIVEGAKKPRALGQKAQQQIQALLAEKSGRTLTQRKIGSRLLHARKKHLGRAMAKNLTSLRTQVPIQLDGTTEVDIEAEVSESLIAQIEAAGGTIVNQSSRYHTLRAKLPIRELETVATLPAVHFIRSADRMLNNSHDPVAVNVSQGDIAHRADLARATFGVDGTGLTIGVLSNGVDSLAARQASGDLPSNITVLPGKAGSGDEGTAILEIVHDIAPGASLLYATAFGSQATFATNIEALRTTGADIIVDDVFYFAEHVFQDGIIAQAVNTVTNDGALYFSSAGNSGNLNDGTSGVWEGDFVQTAAPSVLGPGVTAHSFNGSNVNTITKDPPVLITLQWSDPAGGSNNDYDLFLLSNDLNTVFDFSSNIQNGFQDPIEFIDSSLFDDTNNQLVIVQHGGAANRFLHLNTHRGQLGIATDGQISGHAAANEAFGVAAVNVATAGGGNFVGGGTNPVETFSSDGPRQIFYNPNSTPITPGNVSSTGGLIRQKPDIAAADGVATSTPGFNPFFGTSAAAPHAAAIAALVLQADPSLIPTDLRNTLQTTSLDIENTGYDRDSGYGLVDAFLAVQSVAIPPTFPISVNLNGTGNGTVTSNPVGINCPADCTEEFAENNLVTLIATPNPGSVFSGWNGAGCIGTGECNLTMDQAHRVDATFSLNPLHTLTLTLTGSGTGTITSSPTGVSCRSDCTEDFLENSLVTLTAIPSANSNFDEWTGGGCSGTGHCVVSMTQAQSVNAAFSLLPPQTLSISLAGDGVGTITSSPPGIDCGSDCTEDFPYATGINLSATADPGSHFAGWSGNPDCTDGLITMDSFRNCTAHFVLTGTITRVSVDSSGQEGTQMSFLSAISGNGQIVAYSSDAGNLVTNDTNGVTDVFVHDRTTGLTERVSIDSSGIEGNGGSYSPSISQNGNIVAFKSAASNLIPNDTNNEEDIFVHNRTTGITTRVSVDSQGIEGNFGSTSVSWGISISSNGRYVAFASGSTNLVLGDTNETDDIFFHDRETGQTTRVSMNSLGEDTNGGSLSPKISGDGQFIVFLSEASNLVPSDTNSLRDTFVHNRLTGTTTRVSVNSQGEEANGESSRDLQPPHISADGRYVVFDSRATNFSQGIIPGGDYSYVHDRHTGMTSLVGINNEGQPANDQSALAAISADGRFISFLSRGTNLVPFPLLKEGNLFLRDQVNNATFLANLNTPVPPGSQGLETTFQMPLSSDGKYVAFESDVFDLVLQDTNDVYDVFVHEQPRPVNPPQTLTISSTGSGNGTISSLPNGIQCGVDCTENFLSGTVVELTASPAPGSVFVGWSGGTDWTGTNCSGTETCTVVMNQAHTITAIFDLVVDQTPPVVSPPINIIVAAIDSTGTSASDITIQAFLNGATAQDDTDGDVTINITHNAPSQFPLGLTTVTYSVTDSSGNTGTAQATVTITDQTPPVMTPPTSLMLTSPDGQPILSTDPSILTFLGSASASDNVDGRLPVTNNAAPQFPLGVTLVTFVATDTANNVGQTSATVTILSPPPSDDFRTQVVELTIPAGESSITVTAPTFFESVDPQHTISLISGITQHAMGWTAQANQDPREISARVSLDDGSTLTATRSQAINQSDTVWVILIEYRGLPNGPNEFLVRDRRTHNWASGQTATSYGPLGAISDSNQVVVFGAGTENPNTNSNQYDRGDVRAWVDGTNTIQLVRGDGNGAISSAHQVVEFVGPNWTIETGDTTPTPDPGGTDVGITSVGDISKAWVYFTWSTSSANLDERGHRVWLTSPTTLRVQEDAKATGTKTVRWYVIQNPDMRVQTEAANNQFTQDLQATILGFTPVEELSRSFAWVTGLTDGGGNAHSRDMWQFRLTDPSTISLQRGYSGQELSYRYFVIELPGGPPGPDLTPPIITPPTDITVSAIDATGTPASQTAIQSFLNGATATDNIDGDLTGSITYNAPGQFPMGSTIVTFSVTDTAGNTSTAQATVSVNDQTPPVVVPPASLNFSSPNGQPVPSSEPTLVSFLGGATALDNVDGALPTIHDTPAQFGFGTTTVTFSATDGANNTGTAQSTVTILDQTPPVLTTPANITVTAIDASGTPASDSTIQSFFSAATATDNADGDITSAITHNGPSVFPLGATPVTFSVTDSSNNTSTAQASVTITDQTPPSISTPNNIIVAAIDATGTPVSHIAIQNFLNGATATDNVDGDVTSSINHDAPTQFPLGGTLVTFSVSDTAGNTTATQATVEIIDQTPPVVTPPTPLIFAPPNGQPVPSSNPTINAFLGGATALDNVDGGTPTTHNAPTLFGFGTTTVTFSATDVANNTGTAQATVTILDQTPPVLTPPANITVAAVDVAGTPSSAPALQSFFNGATAMDNADGNLSSSITHNAPGVFPLGSTLVMFSVTDSSNNTSTAQASVTVTDQTPPVVTPPVQLTVISSNGQPIPATDPAILTFLGSATALDNVDGSLSTTHNAPSQFPLGTTIVTFSATDDAGNTGTSASTIIIDNTPPPAPIKINFQPSGVPVPSGFLEQDNTEYTSTRGYGWEPTSNRYRDRNAHPDQERDTFVLHKNSKSPAIWKMDLPNGNYLITLESGDPAYESGGHRIEVEGEVILNDIVKAPGEFATVTDYVITVSDGQLTVKIGESAIGEFSALNYLIITPQP